MDDSLGFLILMWIASSFLVAYIGNEKQRSYFAWLAIGIFFSPLFGLLALAALPKGSQEMQAEAGFKIPSKAFQSRKLSYFLLYPSKMAHIAGSR